MDVKSIRPSRPVLPAGVPAGGSASAPVPLKAVSLGNGKSDDDKKSLSTDAVPSAPSSPEDIRKALIAELLESNSSVEIQRWYQGTLTAWSDTHVGTLTGGVATLNAVSQGVGPGQRLGNTIRMRRLRLRVHVRPAQIAEPMPADTVPSDIEYSFAYRIIVGLDKMPVIGAPVYADTNSWDLGATYPKSSAATHSNQRANLVGGAAFEPGMAMLGYRNPMTLRRYHILFDEFINPSSEYNMAATTILGSTTNGAAYWRTTSRVIDADIPLHNSVEQWYDQGNDDAIMSNKLFFMVIADAPAANPVKYKWQSELEFENVA